MIATLARPAGQAVPTDLGDVLSCDYLPAAAAAWGTRLGVTGGSDTGPNGTSR